MSHPITVQPGGHQGEKNEAWQVPRALDDIRNMDYIRVKQNLEWCESWSIIVCCCNCCETENSYKILTAQGTELFTAKEESCCCCRYACDSQRPFNMYVKDKNDEAVMLIDRPLRCQAGCCCPCCLQKVDIYAPLDVKVGAVVQNWGCSKPTFDIEDQEGNAVLRVSGPCACCNCGVMCEGSCCAICCCRTVGFDIHRLDDDETEIGMIRKEHSGMAKESTTDADNFYVTFPRDLDLNLKLSLLGTVFLLDYMYFEKSPKPTSADDGD